MPLYDELNDVPDDPSPYGIAGWMDDEKHVLVYDRYDIWSLDLDGIESPVNISNSFGRNNNLRFRYSKLDPEAEFISRKEIMFLSAFNYDNKEAGFYTLKPGKATDPSKLVMEKASFPGELIKAEKADRLLWQKGTFTNSPELYLSNMDFGGCKENFSYKSSADQNITGELQNWLNGCHLTGRNSRVYSINRKTLIRKRNIR